ncbi:MAG: tyrosine-type recombinase/integrase [Ignavibacteriaceae bacterium]|jgi:integrase|nr:tyrosine-type recombinase/integrase [Ignavibacteriaceae bacterium]
MYLRKRGKYWHARFFDTETITVKEKSLKTTNRQEAMQKLFAEGISNPASEYSTRTDMPNLLETIDLYAKSKINDPLAPKTIIAYNSSVKKAIKILGNKKINKYTKTDFTQFIQHLRTNTKCRDNTIAYYTRHLHTLFYFLQQEKYIENNPVTKTKTVDIEVKPIPPEHLEMILQNLLSKGLYSQYYLCKLAYLGAFRKNEILNLRVEDIDMKNKLIYFRDTRGLSNDDTLQRTKGKRTDTIPMLDDTYEFFTKMIMPKEGRIFHYRSYEGVKTFWNTVMKHFGFKYKFHALRISRGTDLANAGVKLQFLQLYMRHRDYRTTLKHYIKIDIEQQRISMNNDIHFALSENIQNDK